MPASASPLARLRSAQLRWASFGGEKGVPMRGSRCRCGGGLSLLHDFCVWFSVGVLACFVLVSQAFRLNSHRLDGGRAYMELANVRGCGGECGGERGGCVGSLLLDFGLQVLCYVLCVKSQPPEWRRETWNVRTRTPSLFVSLPEPLAPRAWTPALPSIRNQDLYSGLANDAVYTDQLVPKGETSLHHPIPPRQPKLE